METNKKMTVCSLEDAAHNVELSEYMAENEVSDITEFFEADVEKLQIDDNLVFFLQIEMSKSDIIVFCGDYEAEEEKVKKILTRFFSSNFTDYFEKKEAVWSEFKNNCIAFRSGKGYVYAIWQYVSE